MRFTSWGPVLLFLAALPAARGQEPLLPPGNEKPIPLVEPEGPWAAVSALVFSDDSQYLYAAGLDKVVRFWKREKAPQGKEQFVLKGAYRIPIGPGNSGAINALALAPGGKWLAVGGRGLMRGEAGFDQVGLYLDRGVVSAPMQRDVGVIYLLDPSNPAGGKVLRGHQGEVLALAFAPAQGNKPPLLVSASREQLDGQATGTVRVWDVQAGTQLAVLSGLPAHLRRPSLAVWHTGGQPRQVRVAISWQEVKEGEPGQFRLWDVAQGQQGLRSFSEGAHNSTLAMLQAGQDVQLITGSFDMRPPYGGQLMSWQMKANAAAEPKSLLRVRFDPVEKVHFLPRALAAFRSQPNGPLDHAAVVLRSSARQTQLELALVHLAGQQPEPPLRQFAVAEADVVHPPALAATPDGRYLAVAAFRDRSIALYPIADLMAGNNQPLQVLRAVGLSLEQVAFIQQGRSLWLGTQAQGAPLTGGMIFDLEKRSLVRNPGNAGQIDGPAPAGWEARREGRTIRVIREGKEVATIQMEETDEVTDVALLPPRPGQSLTLLAVAHTDRETLQSPITLYDAGTGRPIRRLTGHLHAVRRLAFSGSRPLLASVAEDRTVCLWSLADLAGLPAAPQHQAVGVLRGVTVQDRAGQVVIAQVEPGSRAATAGLKEGDVLEGVGPATGPPRPVRTPLEFYFAVRARQPGDQVLVKIKDRQQPVAVRVERGQDERKPLASLFVIDPGQGGNLEWIGWNPTGPYDASGARAEKYLGFHTNKGDPRMPATFASVDRYRKDFYREGILKYLVEKGSVGPALQAWDRDHPPPEARLQLWLTARPTARPAEPTPNKPLPNNIQLVGDRGYLVRQAPLALAVGLNEDFPVGDRSEVRWQPVRKGGQLLEPGQVPQPQQAKADGPHRWRADLSALLGKPGDYEVRVSLHDGDKEIKAETISFRLQPPPPQLKLSLAGREITPATPGPPARPAGPLPSSLVVNSAELTIQGQITSPSGQDVLVGYSHRVNGARRPAPQPRLEKPARPFQQQLTLEPGVNFLEFVARNQDALLGHEKEETTRLEVQVSFKPPNEPLPTIEELRLTPAPTEAMIQGKPVLVVDASRVRVQSRVSAKHPLTEARFIKDGQDRDLLPAARDKQELALDETIDLKVDQPHTLRVRPWRKFRHLASTELVVVYHPRLPQVTLAAPVPGPDLFEARLLLQGNWQQPGTDEPFQVEVQRISGQVLSRFPADLDRDRGRWSATIELLPGENQLAVQVRNQWRKQTLTEQPLVVFYRRPPRLLPADRPVVVQDRALIDLAVRVQTPAELPPLEVLINETRYPFSKKRLEEGRGLATWDLQLEKVAVKVEDRPLETLVVAVSNADGFNRDRAEIQVKHVKPTPPPPRLFFRDPRADDTTDREAYAISFQVESSTPLERVEVWRGQEVLFRSPLTDVKKEAGGFVLEVTTPPVKLRPGPNLLRYLAFNQGGGKTERSLNLSYSQPPVLVQVEELEWLDQAGKVQTLAPALQSPDAVRFPRVPGNLVWLKGQVRWSKTDDRQLQDPSQEIVVYVNRVRQLPAVLDRQQGAVRRFRVPIVLTRAENNRIELELPRAKQQQLSFRECTVDCEAPLLQQRLHLLIVGVDVENQTQLKEQVLLGLGALPASFPPTARGQFHVPAFTSATLYNVLAGSVEKRQVETELHFINQEIRQLFQQTGWLNDLVLVYYQGSDVVNERKERYLLTSKNRLWPQAPVEVHAVAVQELPRLPGVQVMLLNVAPEDPKHGTDIAFGWGGDPYAAFLRFAWLSAAETRTAAPRLLALLQEVIKARERLGDVVADLNQRFKEEKQAWKSDVLLDRDIGERIIRKPTP